MKIQRSCTYLHKLFAVRELKKALDFVRHERTYAICHSLKESELRKNVG